MQKWPVLLLILFTIFSCGKNTDEKTADIILDANIEMSRGNCQYAIESLEKYGRQKTNALYLKTLASAYACRGGYNTITFFQDDLSKTATPPPFGGSSTYGTSTQTFQNPLESDPSFVDLQTAITILLYAGNIATTTEPTSANRAKYFTTAELSDLNAQLMYMEMVQLGRLLKTYGNANAAGKKGAGTSGNLCFSKYTGAATHGTMAAAIAGLAGLTSACFVSTDTGHPQITIGVTAADRKRRMCHGVVLLNGFYDSLAAVISSATGSTAATGAIVTAAAGVAKTALTTAYPGIGTVVTTMNQTLCEDNSVVPVDELEAYYALMMESSIL